MSKQSLDAFRKKLGEDEKLRSEMARVLTGGGSKPTASVKELVEFAKSHGYDFSFDEARAQIELSDNELDRVAGGAIVEPGLNFQQDFHFKYDSLSMNFYKISF